MQTHNALQKEAPMTASQTTKAKNPYLDALCSMLLSLKLLSFRISLGTELVMPTQNPSPKEAETTASQTTEFIQGYLNAFCSMLLSVKLLSFSI